MELVAQLQQFKLNLAPHMADMATFDQELYLVKTMVASLKEEGNLTDHLLDTIATHLIADKFGHLEPLVDKLREHAHGLPGGNNWKDGFDVENVIVAFEEFLKHVGKTILLNEETTKIKKHAQDIMKKVKDVRSTIEKFSKSAEYATRLGEIDNLVRVGMETYVCGFACQSFTTLKEPIELRTRAIDIDKALEEFGLTTQNLPAPLHNALSAAKKLKYVPSGAPKPSGKGPGKKKKLM
jgi:hypothetical protein